MKRFVFTILLGFSLPLYEDAFAQVDLSDPHWKSIFIEEFNGEGRGWNSAFKETQTGVQKFHSRWKCSMRGGAPNLIVTGGFFHRHVYQRSNARFGTGVMDLVAEYKSSETMLCNDFELPTGMSCNNNNLRPVYYYSGMIETIDSLGFGYYEMKCKVPIHLGSAASFWFFAAYSGYYEEIDIMEYTNIAPITHSFTNGIWYNPEGSNYLPDQNHIGYAHCIAHDTIIWNTALPNISYYHTYACEWMPDRITWFFDGKVVNDYRINDSIPKHPMFMKITHPIMKTAVDSIGAGVENPIWTGEDNLKIDYVKAYRLDCDCDSDVTIQTSSQLENFVPKVKHSISIGNPGNTIATTSSSNIVMRAESITISNVFEALLGGKVTLISQECPDW